MPVQLPPWPDKLVELDKSVDALIAWADSALYDAKHAACNGFRVFLIAQPKGLA